jgi:hypothetical protein
MKRIVETVGAFYRNDVPEGFGLICDDQQQAQAIADAMARCYQGFKASPSDEQRAFLTTTLPVQLREASRLHKLGDERMSFGERQRFIIFGACNVYIMEHEGLLQPDQFNGCQFVYGVEKIDGLTGTFGQGEHTDVH